MKIIPGVCLVIAICVSGSSVAGTAEPMVEFTLRENQVDIRVGQKPLGSYAFRDESILRPYFSHVHAPSGVQVTRTHPPVEGTDPTDHANMHPGIWLAFGELGGTDFWRNKGTVKHVKFVEPPVGKAGSGRFTALNHYRDGERLVCEETCQVTIQVRPAGYLLLLDSKFSGPERFAFGDQEEMGLGVRVATPLAVKQGGRITNAAGLTNEKQVWGQTADWCDYSGTLDGNRAGLVVMAHPDNFRRSWFHARDYGLLVANPFGRNAFTKGEKSRVEVQPGESLRLRFGVLIYSSAEINPPKPADEYRDYLESAK